MRSMVRQRKVEREKRTEVQEAKGHKSATVRDAQARERLGQAAGVATTVVFQPIANGEPPRSTRWSRRSKPTLSRRLRLSRPRRCASRRVGRRALPASPSLSRTRWPCPYLNAGSRRSLRPRHRHRPWAAESSDLPRPKAAVVPLVDRATNIEAIGIIMPGQWRSDLRPRSWWPGACSSS